MEAKDPKFQFTPLEKLLALPLVFLSAALVWAIANPDQLIDLSLKANKAWENVLTFLLTPIR